MRLHSIGSREFPHLQLLTRLIREWTSKRLPTEAEWEYTARGNFFRKRYLWRDKIDKRFIMIIGMVEEERQNGRQFRGQWV
ncbi:TPA: hypothetical protein DHW51_14765 [Candidatus Poribacteria bacterium]|nr:hypothetical protein [Candidatus Poribacteria bacterium]